MGDLKDFIASARGTGAWAPRTLTDGEVRRRLQDDGWQGDDIDVALGA